MLHRPIALLSLAALVACTDPAPSKDAPKPNAPETAPEARAAPEPPAWERTTPLEASALASSELIIDKEARELRLPGRINTAGFALTGGQPGYHFLCYEQGRIAPLALVATPVSDLAIQSALQSLGGAPGENLEQACWDEREDPKSPAATRKVKGSAVAAFLILDDERVPLGDLIESPGKRGLDLRLGGNLKLRPAWKSGCVICLVSCPGGRLSNAAYSCHEYGAGLGRFKLREGADKRLKDGAAVTVVLALKGR